MFEHSPLPWEVHIEAEEDARITLRVQNWDEPLVGDWRGCIIATLKPILGRDDSAHRTLANAQFIVRVVNGHGDLLAALERHEWYGTDWDTWRCASCSAEIQDGEERHHDASCPTAAAINKARSEMTGSAT